MVHDNFKNAPAEWQEVNHELVGKQLRMKTTSLKVTGKAIAAYRNKYYDGKPDAHTAVVVTHEPVTWGPYTYTQSVLWFFDNGSDRNSWYEVIEQN